jgi:hypothetical protein
MSDIAEPDHGQHLGPAAHARPSEMHTVGGRAVSSVRAEAIVVKRYRDCCAYDRMHEAGQISDRQHAAAVKFAGLWVAASLERITMSRYGEAGGEEHAPDDEPTAADIYRKLTRSMRPHYVSAMENLMLDRHPGSMGLVHTQDALDDLADNWNVPEHGE